MDKGERMVMKTSSFGHGTDRLDICVREGGIFQEEAEKGFKAEEVNGMYEAMAVPLAIMSSYRSQGWEMGKRYFRC